MNKKKASSTETLDTSKNANTPVIAPNSTSPTTVSVNPVNSKVTINNVSDKGASSSPSIGTQNQIPDSGGIINQTSNVVALSPIVFSSSELIAVDDFQTVGKRKRQRKNAQQLALERIHAILPNANRFDALTSLQQYESNPLPSPSDLINLHHSVSPMEEIRDFSPDMVPPPPNLEFNSEETPPNPTVPSLKELDDNVVIEVIYAKPNPVPSNSKMTLKDSSLLTDDISEDEDALIKFGSKKKGRPHGSKNKKKGGDFDPLTSSNKMPSQ